MHRRCASTPVGFDPSVQALRREAELVQRAYTRSFGDKKKIRPTPEYDAWSSMTHKRRVAVVTGVGCQLEDWS